MNQNLRKNLKNLFAAYGLTFLIIGLAYLAYSRLLSPGEFGLYSIALMIANIGTMILDGGIKNAIIKHEEELTDVQRGSLLSWMILISILLILGLFGLKNLIAHFLPTTKKDYAFLALFGSAYLIAYPWVSIPTALMERKLLYRRLAWLECASNSVERGVPALIMLTMHQGLYSFIWGAFIGRLFRAISVNYFYRVRFRRPDMANIRTVAPLLSEGFWLQASLGTSFIRDNLHILILGPFFGKVWVGYYSWALQLSAVASQAFVQISTRVSFSMMAQAETFNQRWDTCIDQIKLLSKLTTPVLILLLAVMPDVDTMFFHGNWAPAIKLLPFLFIRMLFGSSMTPLGALLPIEKGGFIFFKSLALWTALEVAVAAIFIYNMGPIGLAISYSITVIAGILIILRHFKKESLMAFREIAAAIFASLNIALAALFGLLLVGFRAYGGMLKENHFFILGISLLGLLICYLSESEIRGLIGMRYE